MKTLVCIFAHPDDEAFGPGGTIAILAKTNNVYILCATKGEAGKNSLEGKRKLGEIRSGELIESAKILGVKKVFFLGFEDGTLNNNLYHKLAKKIEEKLNQLQPDILLTFELRGVSGHIDHITVAMVTRYVFSKLCFVKQLWYYCAAKFVSESQKNYFIFFPEGFNRSEVDKIVDTKKVWNTKVKAMHAHKSQAHDIERILKMQETRPREEFFFIIKK